MASTVACDSINAQSSFGIVMQTVLPDTMILGKD